MGKKSNLTHQAIKELKKETHIGESKHELKEQAKAKGENPAAIRGIYSSATYNSYLKVAKQFVSDTLSNHGKNIRNLSDCKQYVPEFLESRQSNGVSAWTLAQYGSALGSMYHCSKNDFNFTYPSRNRADIKRCRGENSSDYKYPEEKWNIAKLIIKATGTRRLEALRLRKEDFRTNEKGEMEVYKRGKNGIERWCLVNPQYQSQLRDYLKSAETHKVDGEDRLLLKAQLPKGSIHDMRADYAKDLYRYLEERGDVATGKIYHCKKDKAGESYDKGILAVISHSLQHSRNSVVVNNYLWK